MAKIFITGSADGLGQLAGKELVRKGHDVVWHARNRDRANQVLNSVPEPSNILIADLSVMEETKRLAEQVNALGDFDAVIHNAGVYQVPDNSQTKDGLPLLFAVNTIAPYILTCLIRPPKRLIYLSSGMHRGGDPSLDGLSKASVKCTYSDSKLHDLILAKAIARKWPNVSSNAVDPGWVPTKMGGAGAPDNLEKGYETQVWLATSNDENALISGRYLHHKKNDQYLAQADDISLQEKLLGVCKTLTDISFS